MKLTILRADKLNARKAARVCCRWFIFNEEYHHVQQAENLLDKENRLDLSKDIRRNFERAKWEYSKRLLPLHRKFDGKIEWLLSPVSGKTDWPPEYIINLSIFWALKEHLADNPEDIVILTTNHHLVSLIQEIPGAVVDILESFWALGLKKELNFWAGCAYQIVKTITWMVFAKRLKAIDYPSRVDIFLRTYVFDNSFKPSGEFRDVYLQELPRILQERGCSVLIEPNCSSIRRIGDFIRWMNRFGQALFFVRERYLSFFCILHAFNVTLKSRLLLQYIDPSFKMSLKSYGASAVFTGYLKAQTPVYLKRLGIDPKAILFLWENTPYEKVLMLYVRKYLQATRIDGYSHGLAFDTHQALNMSAEEYTFTPLPDRLICSSEYLMDRLREVGIPGETLIKGPNLRQRFNVKSSTEMFHKPVNDLLVVFSIVYGTTVELLDLIMRVAVQYPERNIYLKLHPSVEITDLLKNLGSSLPSNVFNINCSMEDTFALCPKVVVANPTTVLLEALCHGCNVREFISRNSFYNSNIRPNLQIQVPKIQGYEDLVSFLLEQIGWREKMLDADYIFNNSYLVEENEIHDFFAAQRDLRM